MGLCQRLIFRIKLNEYNWCNPYNLVPGIEEQAKKKKKDTSLSIIYGTHDLGCTTVYHWVWCVLGFLSRSAVKNLPAMPKTHVWSLDQKDPLEKSMATHSSILSRKIPWSEEPVRLRVHGVTKSQLQLSTHVPVVRVLPSSVCVATLTSSSMEAVSHSSRITPWAG